VHLSLNETLVEYPDRSYLCIGGPLDGQWKAALCGPRLDVPFTPCLASSHRWLSEPNAPGIDLVVEIRSYHLEQHGHTFAWFFQG
jgi:hypothetical protein